MKVYMNTTKCKPMVECEVYDPYDSPGSVLAESQCIKVYIYISYEHILLLYVF